MVGGEEFQEISSFPSLAEVIAEINPQEIVQRGTSCSEEEVVAYLERLVQKIGKAEKDISQPVETHSIRRRSIEVGASRRGKAIIDILIEKTGSQNYEPSLRIIYDELMTKKVIGIAEFLNLRGIAPVIDAAGCHWIPAIETYTNLSQKAQIDPSGVQIEPGQAITTLCYVRVPQSASVSGENK